MPLAVSVCIFDIDDEQIEVGITEWQGRETIVIQTVNNFSQTKVEFDRAGIDVFIDTLTAYRDTMKE